MLRCFFAMVLTVFLMTPAVANEYWVAQNASNKRCKVVDAKPDGKMWVIVGTSSYSSLGVARAARRAAAECPKIGPKTAKTPD